MTYPMRPTKHEVKSRIETLHQTLTEQGVRWDAAFIVDKINQYYLTGTMQDAVFVLKRNGDFFYFVRRNMDRARDELLIDDVFPMTGYRDIYNAIGGESIRDVYIETDIMTCAMLERFKKYFAIENILAADRPVMQVRSVKSAFELECIRESARQHKTLMHDIVPRLMREGMSETEFSADIFREMVNLGYQGIPRFAMFQTEMVVGQLGFGENSIYPTNFDGPGGMRGMHPAAPVVGDRTRLLQKGDLVFVDIGYGIGGYHSDMTQVYMFGAEPPAEAVKAHRGCMKVQRDAASLLKPGAIPADIYNTVMSGLDEPFRQNFMGYGDSSVKFLGHGVGLCIDETPVIAGGCKIPLKENMVIALEPKKGVAGIGMVGVEDTYVVTPDGGLCLTGGERDILVV